MFELQNSIYRESNYRSFCESLLRDFQGPEIFFELDRVDCVSSVTV